MPRAQEREVQEAGHADPRRLDLRKETSKQQLKGQDESQKPPPPMGQSVSRDNGFLGFSTG